jgi:hypothetical protein
VPWTASWAITSSNAITASYAYQAANAVLAQNVVGGALVESASYAITSDFAPVLFNNVRVVDGNLLIRSEDTNNWFKLTAYDDGSGSYTTQLTQSLATGSLLYTGSINCLSASYATTASYALNGGSGVPSDTASLAYTASSVDYFNSDVTKYGYDSLLSASGSFGTAIGWRSGRSASTSSRGTFLGAFAGELATDAVESTYVGYAAGYSAKSSSNAVMVGYNAGWNATTASYTTFIGAWAGLSGDLSSYKPINVDKSIAIGYNARVSGSNQCVLGGTGSDAVNVGINTDNPTNRLHVGGNVFATSFTGSLFGTASYSIYSVSSTTSEYSLDGQFCLSSSYATNASTASLVTSYRLISGSIVPKVDSYTLTNNDDGKLLSFSGSTGNVTISGSVLSPYFSATFYQSGSTQLSFLTSSGTTLRNRSGYTKSAGQYSLTSLVRINGSEFVLGGDTGA